MRDKNIKLTVAEISSEAREVCRWVSTPVSDVASLAGSLIEDRTESGLKGKHRAECRIAAYENCTLFCRQSIERSVERFIRFWRFCKDRIAAIETTGNYERRNEKNFGNAMPIRNHID
jgi:hypothetical protein